MDSGTPIFSLPKAVGRSTEYRLSLEGTEDEVLLQKSLVSLLWQSLELSQPGRVSFSRGAGKRVRKDSGLSRLIRKEWDEPALPAWREPVLHSPPYPGPSPTQLQLK